LMDEAIPFFARGVTTSAQRGSQVEQLVLAKRYLAAAHIHLVMLGTNTLVLNFETAAMASPDSRGYEHIWMRCVSHRALPPYLPDAASHEGILTTVFGEDLMSTISSEAVPLLAVRLADALRDQTGEVNALQLASYNAMIGPESFLFMTLHWDECLGLALRLVHQSLALALQRDQGSHDAGLGHVTAHVTSREHARVATWPSTSSHESLDPSLKSRDGSRGAPGAWRGRERVPFGHVIGHVVVVPGRADLGHVMCHVVERVGRAGGGRETPQPPYLHPTVPLLPVFPAWAIPVCLQAQRVYPARILRG
jgi:hypothetical protein